MDSSMANTALPVLQGSSNYHTWREHLRIYIHRVNPTMWEFITGTNTDPADVSDDRLRLVLRQTAGRAVNTLFRAVVPSIAIVIREDQTAHEIWMYLEKRYSKGTVIRPYMLLCELVQLVQIGGVDEFISNIKLIANESSLIGHPIDAGTKLGCLLRGVQPHLHPYTAAYEVQWESLALSKAGKSKGSFDSEYETDLERLFETASMGLRNYEESEAKDGLNVDRQSRVSRTQRRLPRHHMDTGATQRPRHHCTR